MKQTATAQTTPTKGASALLRLLLAAVLALSGLAGAAPAFADEAGDEGGPPPAAAQGDGEEIGEVPTEDDGDATDEGAELVPLAAGDSLAEALPYMLGTTVNGTISTQTTAVFYSFALASSGKLSVELDTQSLQKASLLVYDIDGTVVWENSWGELGWDGTAQKASYRVSVWLNSGEYRFCVRKYGSNTGAYSLKLASEPSNESFKEDYLGSDNTFASAKPVGLGSTYRGQVSYAADPADFYAFTLASSGKLAIELDTQSLEKASLLVYDIDGTVVWENSWGELGWDGTAQKSSYRVSVWLNSGEYRFCVRKYGSNTGAYSFRLPFESSNESFREAYLGSDNTFASANPIVLGTTYRGQVSYAADAADFYRFSLASSGRLAIELDTQTLQNASLLVYDIDGAVVWENSWGELGWNDTAKKANYRNSVWLNGGEYRLCVKKYGSNAGAYSFRLAVAAVASFNANGGSASFTQKDVATGAEIGALPTATRAGHAFLGWFTAKTGGTRIAPATKVTGSATYWAHWQKNTYTVKLTANGGKLPKGKASSLKKAYGSSLGSLAKPTRTGYTFQGWYTAKSGGKKVAATTKVTKNVTLYAHWKARTYTVKLNANGGKVAGKSSASIKRSYNSKLAKLSIPKRSGYKFQGWYTKKAGGKRVGSATKVTRSATYYAHWKRVR
jgi:uncharacterized repeat protein (TIGR02543 family)